MAETLEERLKQQALGLGFDLIGIAPAGPADGFAHLQAWLAAGYAGTMDYLHKHAEARHHPDSILPDVRSVVMAGMSYNFHPLGNGEWGVGNERQHSTSSLPIPHSPFPSGNLAIGKVARYARGADYHQVFWAKLRALLDWLQGERPGCRGRAVARKR